MNKNLILFFHDLLKLTAWEMDGSKFYSMVKFANGEPTVISTDEELLKEFISLGGRLLKSKGIPEKKRKVLYEILEKLKAKDFNPIKSLESEAQGKFLFPTKEDLEVPTTFTEIYEKNRIQKNIEFIPVTLKVLNMLNNEEITLSNPVVWESLRNKVIKNNINIEKLLEEYDSGSESARLIILEMGKDSGKQNTGEDLQKLYAEKNGVVLVKLKPNGSEALRILDGKVYKNHDLTKEQKYLATKSLDFIVENSKDIIYTYNKYTKQTGGSQDDTLRDVKHLIKEFENSEDETKLLVILDGDYWAPKIKTLVSSNKNLMVISTDDYNKPEVKKFLNLK